MISCSDHYSHRLNVIDHHLQERGYHVTYITSDFDHVKKCQFQCNVPGCVQIPAKPYKKNLSLGRILSHYRFARDVFAYLESLPEQPQVIVALIPPNFLAHYAAKYKKAHPEVRLVFDIFDMWPETFPSGRAKKLLAPVFGIWGWVRNHGLDSADYVITECELFRRKLKLPRTKSATVYLCAAPLTDEVAPVSLDEERINLCYLGSANNVVDIDAIAALIGQIKQFKPVTLHIIGFGERMQTLVDMAQNAGAKVEQYGVIYDAARKQQILSRCHFGLNMMKASTCIGLTMKSLDYLRNGLPIINNIPADTERLVRIEGIGVELDDTCACRIAEMTTQDHMQMRENVKQAFDRYFSREVVDKQYKKILDEIL
ncbi:MAG: glycosyltransferase family 4 protein [Ruminococcaceae bacterium]|nr:glycosyltransferase family 4 protein [Oscillospiraceae bacterium]